MKDKIIIPANNTALPLSKWKLLKISFKSEIKKQENNKKI